MVRDVLRINTCICHRKENLCVVLKQILVTFFISHSFVTFQTRDTFLGGRPIWSRRMNQLMPRKLCEPPPAKEFPFLEAFRWNWTLSYNDITILDFTYSSLNAWFQRRKFLNTVYFLKNIHEILDEFIKFF